jgi:hypothetical protein
MEWKITRRKNNMESIRRGVFETNSSSTHSLTMCSESEFEKWKNGELLLNRWDRTFIAKEEYIKKYEENKKKYFEKYPNDTEEDFENYINDDKEYYTYEEFWYDIDYETFKEKYTTEKGEKIVAFGYFGFDG